MADIKETNGSSAANGTNGTNGVNGSHATKKPAGKKAAFAHGPLGKPSKPQKKPGTIGSLMALRKESKRPLPTEMGDGSYRTVVKRPTLKQDLKSFGMNDIKTLIDIISEKVKGETQQDDKTMIMERTIQIVAGLPDHSKTQEILTNSFIDKLWNSLEHPPLIYVGPDSKYRRPDGRFNNPMLPDLGARGHTYARSCKPKVLQLGAQPDPETIFESIMARDGFRKNPNNVSSILWYWATIIIHDLFWTNMKDQNKNDTSSYLDLAPLYGNTQEAQDSIRTFEGGKLKADSFADKRLIGNPPGVCILLVMFNRFHNHVATNLAEINEGGRFVKPTPTMSEEETAAAWKKYDEELFQTARLVTSGLYINITLIDYVRNIINLNRVDSTWTLDPRQEMGVAVGTKAGSEAGVGNVVSAEFNLCYRWHSCISEMDDKWIQDFYNELLGEDHGTLDMRALMTAVKAFEMKIPEDPGKRTFGGFERGPDGSFNDDELMDALATAIEQPGGAFGGRNVPRVMKPVEMLGIIRGRRWNLAGLNEFRKHFGLKAYDTFEDINSEPAVADALRNLYQHPDNVELYPGLVAEEGKSPMVPGVGIAPTYTISRVVLSDAVSLVRGDRFYTIDYHPGNLTNWGYKEVDYDLNVNHGCSFFKLFIRAFPDHFKGNSIYAHYPMVIPEENKKIMANINRADRFSYDRPTRQSKRVDVTSYSAIKHILGQPDTYSVNWASGLSSLLRGDYNLKLTGDAKVIGEQQQTLRNLLYTSGWKESVKNFYSMIAERLLSEKSHKVLGKAQVDIVRDVGNLSHTHFVARLFNLPLKTKENPKGIFSELELYKALSLVFVAIFHDVDPAKSYPLREAAKEVVEKLGGIIETNVKLATTLGLRGMYTAKHKNDPLVSYGNNLFKGLKKSGVTPQDIAWSHVLPTAATLAPNQGQVFAQAVDWYLSPGGAEHLAEVKRLAAETPSDNSDALLLGYALEGARLAGTSSVYRKAETASTIKDGKGGDVIITPGDRVFLSLASAGMDSTFFANPTEVNPRRPTESYTHFATGPYENLSSEMGQVALTELFRTVFRKKNLRKVVGPQGNLKKISENGDVSYLTEDWGSTWPFPTSMKVTWDEQ